MNSSKTRRLYFLIEISLFQIIISFPPGKDLTFIITTELYAQEQKPPYITHPIKTFSDRAEGFIKPSEEDSTYDNSTERIELISATIQNSEPIPAEAFSKYSFIFYLKDSSLVKLHVSELEKLYNLDVFPKNFPPGFNKFILPSQIPLQYNISLSRLFPLAEISGSHGQTIVPVMLSYKKPKITKVVYRFCFISYQQISNFKYKVYQADQIKLVYSDSLQDLRANELIYLSWHEKNDKKMTFSSGLYNLFVEATFQPLSDTRPTKENVQKVKPKVISKNYQFYHYADTREIVDQF